MTRHRMIAVFSRAIIPIGILVAGEYAYRVLSLEPEEARSEPLAEQVIRCGAQPDDETVDVIGIAKEITPRLDFLTWTPNSYQHGEQV